jgi:hypothetical protein
LGSNFEPDGPQLVKICSELMRVRGYASRALPNLVSTAVASLNAAIFLDLRVIANQLFGCPLVAHAFNLKERASAAHIGEALRLRYAACFCLVSETRGPVLDYLDAKDRFITLTRISLLGLNSRRVVRVDYLNSFAKHFQAPSSINGHAKPQRNVSPYLCQIQIAIGPLCHQWGLGKKR